MDNMDYTCTGSCFYQIHLVLGWTKSRIPLWWTPSRIPLWWTQSRIPLWWTQSRIPLWWTQSRIAFDRLNLEYICSERFWLHS